VAAEKDALYLHALRNRFLRTPNVTVCELDPGKASDYQPWAAQFESALCLKRGGTLVVLVPQGKALFSSLDQGMGHKRRFEERDLRTILEYHGFQIEREHQINKIGALSW